MAGLLKSWKDILTAPELRANFGRADKFFLHVKQKCGEMIDGREDGAKHRH